MEFDTFVQYLTFNTKFLVQFSSAGGLQCTEVAFALHTQQPQVFFSATDFPKKFDYAASFVQRAALKKLDSGSLKFLIEPY